MFRKENGKRGNKNRENYTENRSYFIGKGGSNTAKKLHDIISLQT